MNILNKKILCRILSILIFLSLIIPINSISFDFNNKDLLNDEFPQNVNSQHEDFSIIPETTSKSTDFLTRGLVVDRIIGQDKIENITKDLVIGNLTIRDEGVLSVEDCNLTIQGKLKIVEYGQLIIKNSNITIDPGPTGPREIIINFSDNAKVLIESSNFLSLPQTIPTNISYLLSDDNSRVTIIDSNLNCKLPEIENMDIELTPPTAGTFILTGNTIWNISDTKIEGFLKLNETSMLIGRWFLFTLQRNAQLFMKRIYGFLNLPSQPFIKPVAGYVKLEDCRVLQGIIDAEVVAEFEAINLTIVEMNLRDQSNARIFGSRITNILDSGSVAIIPTAYGGQNVTSKVTDKPRTILLVENTTIGGSLIIQGNSTSNIVNSTVDKCSIIHESKITFINSTIRTLIEAKEDTDVRLENTSVPQINLANQSSLYINQESRNLAINKITTSFNYQSEIRLQSTKLNLLDIFAGDQVSPNEYGPGYDPDRNISKINLILVNSQISRIRTEDDSQINITLQNSDLNEFSFKKSKNELVLITILDLGGNYSMPDPWPEVDLEIHIYHRTFVTTLVNNIPIQAFIEVIDQNGKTIKSQYTNSYGRVNLDMLVEQIMKDSFKKAGDYNLNLNYLGFAKTTTLSAGINEKLVIEWEDYNPPNINDIQSDTKYTRTKRDTRIRAEIIDTDVKVVANATIFFQYNRGSGWSPWYTKSMIEVENNIYEGEIPLQPDGTEVRYFIVANDILGNKYESEINKYTIENPEIMVIFAGVVFLCIFFILSILYFMKRRARFKKYLNKPLS